MFETNQSLLNGANAQDVRLWADGEGAEVLLPQGECSSNS